MSKATVLYHDDADGFASACVLRRSLSDEETSYIAVQYSQPVPYIPADTEVLYIVDFSYPYETCKKLEEKYHIMIFDHHKTAKAALELLPYATFSDTLSGCGMMWEYLFRGEPMPLMLQYVQDRDLWKFELPDSEIINLFIATLPFDFDIWEYHIYSVSFKQNAFASGRSIKAFRDGQIKGALRDVRMMVFDGYTVPVVNCSANISEVGNRLCAEYPDAPFSASYCDRKDVRSWSLRSVGEFDVSAVSKAHGGGGHKNAAGFSTDIGWPQIAPDEFVKSFEQKAEAVTWRCCGGKILTQDEKCPVCGEKYD